MFVIALDFQWDLVPEATLIMVHVSSLPLTLQTCRLREHVRGGGCAEQLVVKAVAVLTLTIKNIN
jgi:hypothetical protein